MAGLARQFFPTDSLQRFAVYTKSLSKKSDEWWREGKQKTKPPQMRPPIEKVSFFASSASTAFVFLFIVDEIHCFIH
jgi:hypothetical protein